MNYPKYYKNDTRRAVLFSENEFIEVRNGANGSIMTFGINGMMAEDIRDLGKEGTKLEFVEEMQTALDQLKWLCGRIKKDGDGA